MDIEHVGSAGPPDPAEVIHELGYFGHYLHVHEGGRGGKRTVLCLLHKCDGRITQRELLERTNLSPASISEVLAKLEAEHLIRRRPFEADRRQLSVELTRTGREAARHVRKERSDFERSALSCLTEQEQVVLDRLLGRLVTHWKSMEQREVVA